MYTLRYALVYIYYLHHFHKGTCRRKEPLVQIMDPKKSQCIQKNNTLEVKTPGLIVLFIMTITYISKVATLQVGVVVVTTILKMF